MKFSKYNIIHTTENQEHILFNSLWGSTFVISPSVKQAIESSNPTLLTEEENRLFIKYNALIPDEYNESCIYNHFYNKSRYGKKCLTATVLLTWSCNFRCIYCYEGAGELRCENMTKNRAGAIANFLIKCSEEQRGELMPVFWISTLVTPRFCRTSRFMDCLPCEACLSYCRSRNCIPRSRVRADSFVVEMARLTVLCSISSCIVTTSCAENRLSGHVPPGACLRPSLRHSEPIHPEPE